MVRAYKFYSARWGLDALYRRRLKVSTSRDINDPFEFLAAGNSKATRSEARRVRANLFSKSGLIAFSTTWSEPLLWSHYADNHRGLALGFDLNEGIGHDVRYTDTRINIPIDTSENPRFGMRLQFWENIWITKFSAWSYEREVKVISSLIGSICENGIFFRPFDHIGTLREVIVGAEYRASSLNVELEDSLYSDGIQVKTARLAFKDFSVVPQHAKSLKKAL